jgi:hypothetical protein
MLRREIKHTLSVRHFNRIHFRHVCYSLFFVMFHLHLSQHFCVVSRADTSQFISVIFSAIYITVLLSPPSL